MLLPVAWAHLILYGEEATRKAQEEGEQAVAAYEQEQKDIAEGKIPVPAPTKTKKKKSTPRTKNATSTKGRGRKKTTKNPIVDATNANTAMSNTPITCLEDIQAKYPKMSNEFKGINLISEKEDDALITDVSTRILASRQKETMTLSSSYCIPVSQLTTTSFPSGCALLLGLSSDDFGWKIESFIQNAHHIVGNNHEKDSLNYALQSEFGEDGMNTRFQTIIKGFPCIIGKAAKYLEEAASTLGFYGAGLGGTIGDVDCNIGGMDGTCSEMAAIISYDPNKNSFQLSACGSGKLGGMVDGEEGDDLISVNGIRLDSSKQSMEIGNGSICSVGSRIFMFILASD